MRRLISGFAAAVICTTLAFAAYAADLDKSEQFLKDGRRFFDRGQPQAAIIQFRNAAQADPGNAEAQFALGKALIFYGDPTLAEASLEAGRRLCGPDTTPSKSR
jgi:Flp pilus assembly protein TadD